MQNATTICGKALSRELTIEWVKNLSNAKRWSSYELGPRFHSSESSACEAAYKDGETAFLQVNALCAVCVKSGLPLMISISSLSRPDMCLLHTSRPVARKSKSTFDSERFCTVLHFQFQEASRTPFQAWQAECEDDRRAEDQKVKLKELLELDYLVEESQ